MDENELACRHRDHSRGRNVKGINILPVFYVSPLAASDESLHILLAYEAVKKTAVFSEIKTRKPKRQSVITKNEMMRQMILQQIKNQVSFKYVPAGSWFASGDSIRLIASRKGLSFISDMKDNRLLLPVNRFAVMRQNISQLTVPENVPVKVWLKDLDFPGLLVRQVFIDKGRSTGTGFPVSNGFTLSAGQFTTLCKKRWSVEEYHKGIRQNASAGSSPARSVRARSNHLLASVFAFVKLEKIKRSKNMNHFAVKAGLYLTVIKIAFPELNDMKENLSVA